MSQLVEQLDSEPALAWKVAVNVLGKSDGSPEAQRARTVVRDAPLIRALIATCDRQSSPYKKWDGAHWVLSILADLGCPAGDESLRPLMDETFDCWLSKAHEKYIRQVAGRTRRCASQEGNAVWS
jgi:hypothetical protein